MTITVLERITAIDILVVTATILFSSHVSGLQDAKNVLPCCAPVARLRTGQGLVDGQTCCHEAHNLSSLVFVSFVDIVPFPCLLPPKTGSESHDDRSCCASPENLTQLRMGHK